jgi:hypothetical protein
VNLIAGGREVKVDAEDYESLKGFSWLLKWRTPDHPYVYRYERLPSGKQKKIRLHRQIMGFPDLSISVDHMNGDTLDNRRCNLRLASQRQNSQNMRRRNDKKYKGVSKANLIHGKYQPSSPWRSRIRVDGKLINLGHYKTEEQAALAYNEAAKKHFGEFACLNDIQEVA